MFGLGIPEILSIIIVAVVILGPEQMPRAARLLGKWSAKIRSASTSLNQAIRADEDLRDLQSNIETVRTEWNSAKRELLAPARQIRDIAGDAVSDGKKIAGELKEVISPDAATGRGDAPKTAPEKERETEKNQASDDAPNGLDLPESLDFLNRPMDWFSEGISSQPRSRFSLAAPKLLPGEISRQVSRTKISLEMPKPSLATGTKYKLNPPDPSRALCRHYLLSSPQPNPNAECRMILPKKK